MTAQLIVTIELATAADHDTFDVWYRDAHLPQACAALGALSARRGWSALRPGVHVAIYDFAGLEAAQSGMATPEVAALIGDFLRLWAGRARMSHELVQHAQQVTGTPG